MKSLPGKMNYNFKGKEIFVFSDPAGANSVLALVDQLIKEGKRNGIDFLIFTNPLGIFPKSYNKIITTLEFSDEKAVDIISEFKPNVLFSATSLNDFEHNWRKMASKNNIKTIAFIDHWTSYYERFSFRNETIFANEIWVINDVAKREAISAGIPEELLTISGNPYYEKVKKYKPEVAKIAFFSMYKIDSTKKTILFISDDIRRSFPVDNHNNCTLGFDEYTVFKDILVSLKELENIIDYRLYQLVIKLHPRDEKRKYESLIDNITPKNLEIHSIQKCDPLTINYYSDYVLGMFSNMVIEALIMQKKVLRVQTGEQVLDLMKFTEYPFLLITKRSKLSATLFSLLTNE